MKPGDLKFALFSIGMGSAIASSFTSIYLLAISFAGGKSVVYESNAALALVEIILLIFGISSCVVAAEVFQKYQEASSPNGNEHTKSD